MFAYYYVLPDYRAAAVIVDLLGDVANRAGTPECALHATWAQACIQYNAGSLEEARQLLEKAIADDDSEPALELAVEYGQEPHIGIRVYQECVGALMGQIAAADAASRDAVERARALGHPFTLCYALTLSTIARIYRRDFAGAAQRAADAIAVADQHGFELLERFS